MVREGIKKVRRKFDKKQRNIYLLLPFKQLAPVYLTSLFHSFRFAFVGLRRRLFFFYSMQFVLLHFLIGSHNLLLFERSLCNTFELDPWRTLSACYNNLWSSDGWIGFCGVMKIIVTDEGYWQLSAFLSTVCQVENYIFWYISN